MGNYVFSVKYPDSVTGMWRFMHRQPAEEGKLPMTEKEVVKAWNDFSLTVMPEAEEVSDKFGASTAQDAAADFLAALFAGPCPSEITTAGILKKKAKKYFSQKWNPCGKEVYDVLSDAVRDLVKKGALARSDPDKNIGSATRFWLAGSAPMRTATPVECERKFSAIPMVGSRTRDLRTKDKRMLTPTDAAQVVLRLFDIMGNDVAIAMQELMSCALNRTRNVMSPFVESYVETDKEDGLEDGPKGKPSDAGGEDLSKKAEASAEPEPDDANSVEPMPDLVERLQKGYLPEEDVSADSSDGANDGDSSTADEIDDQRFLREQLGTVSRATAERIWSRVLKANSDKVFCLYSLPKFAELKTKTKLEDIGVTSTVGAKHLKMRDVLEDELAFIVRQPDQYRFGPVNVLHRIWAKLIGRCAEKGHNVPL